MLSIDLKNIQAIGEAHIVIEDNSIVEFTGDNSNGKSVISKVIEKLTSGDIRHKEVRLTLIKDGYDQGVVLFTHNAEQLGVILSYETKDSLVMYRSNVAKPDEYIARSMSDADGVSELVNKFGFRTYANGDICLQLAPTFGAVPFVTTSGAINDEIVQDITTDKIADEFINSFQTITFPIFKDMIARKKKERENYQVVLDNLESYNWHDYDSIYNRMKEIYDAIGTYVYTHLEEVPIPDLSIIPVQHFELEQLPVIQYYDLCEHIYPIDKELKDYIDIINGVCPTCGRRLIDCAHTGLE